MNSIHKTITVMLLIFVNLLFGSFDDFLVRFENKSGDLISTGLIIQESGVVVTTGVQFNSADFYKVRLADGSLVSARLTVNDSDNKLSFWLLDCKTVNYIDLDTQSALPVIDDLAIIKAATTTSDYQKEATCLSFFRNGNIKLSPSANELLDGSTVFNKKNQFLGLAFNHLIGEKKIIVLISANKIVEAYKKNLSVLSVALQANLDEFVILKLQGSNTIGAQLADSIASAYLLSIGCREITFRQGKSIEEKKVRGIFNNQLVTIEISAHGSSTAFSGLKNSECDIGMSSRPIKSKETEELSLLGDMTSYQNEHVLGLDGIAIITNRANPVNKLTIAQLTAIFSGEIKEWSEITPYFAGPIKILSRDDKSGTYDSFKSMILSSGKPEKKLATYAEKIESSVELSDKVARDANAIGFIGLPYIRDCKALEIAQQLQENQETAFYPTVFSVATEDYALSRRLFLYTPEKSTNPHCRGFVEYALGNKGQDIVEKCGFVSQNIAIEKPILPPNSTPKYVSAVKDSKRLSLNFRFKQGSFDLDNKSFRDLSRVADFLKSKRNKEILLLGFADNTGNPQANYQLSAKRASTISNLLKKWGIRSEAIIAMGEDVPIASNDSEEGRQKNRRVEILLKN